jgi:hypothetical protein
MGALRGCGIPDAGTAGVTKYPLVASNAFSLVAGSKIFLFHSILGGTAYFAALL